MKYFSLVALGIVLTTAACDNSSSTTPTTTSPATTTIPISGTIPAAVNGVPQSDSHNFTVGQSGGTVTITLTNAVETLVGGTQNLSAVVGLGIGTPSGATCNVTAGTVQILQPSASPLSGALNPGTWCLQMTNEDTSALSGPVTYAVTILTP